MMPLADSGMASLAAAEAAAPPPSMTSLND